MRPVLRRASLSSERGQSIGGVMSGSQPLRGIVPEDFCGNTCASRRALTLRPSKVGDQVGLLSGDECYREWLMLKNSHCGGNGQSSGDGKWLGIREDLSGSPTTRPVIPIWFEVLCQPRQHAQRSQAAQKDSGRCATFSLKLGKLSLRLLQDGDVGVGVFPKSEEVLVGG